MYQENIEDGLFITDIEVEKLANGQFKASSCGLEAHDYSQENAVDKLQGLLNDAMAQGTVYPGMDS